MKKVIIAEDDYVVAELFKNTIEEYGHEVVAVAHTAKKAVKEALAHKPDMILLDINMEYRAAGIDACREIKKKLPETKAYFLTAYTKDVFDKELKGVSYDGYIDKVDFIDKIAEFLKRDDI
jgi:CheY-like chemotaxis protein